MDHEKLKMLAHLKILSRKAGHELDLPRLIADQVYASAALDKFMADGNEELIMTALAVKEKLGLMPQPAAAAPAPPEPAAEDPPKKDTKKYVFGPRG
jgi:hypothetical protein